ncbi:MAG: response regulator [Nitrospirales bacterium]
MRHGILSPTVLVADDNPDDCLLTMRAWEESQLQWDVRFVHDGRDLLDYLFRRGKYRKQIDLPHPHLILLDLNMPKKDGRQALLEIQANPLLQHIPIVVFTDSTCPNDAMVSEGYGAFDFFTKPSSFIEYVQLITGLGKSLDPRKGVLSRGATHFRAPISA